MKDLHGTVALVTGASRGIGASLARILAQKGANIVVNYRSKARRAEEVAAVVRAAGREALPVQADLASDADVQAMMAAVAERFGRLDLLVLNASGGLEKDRPPEYATQINVTAQVTMAERALPLMPSGGRIVFVTSHWAHYYGQKPVPPVYEPIAASKKAGEEALRERIALMNERGVSLVVVSGDVIDGTITPRLMERMAPGLIEKRREEVGYLITVEEFARSIAEAAIDDTLETGATILVGGIP